MTTFIFLNLSNHPVAEWQKDQVEEAQKLALGHLKKKLQLEHESIDETDLITLLNSIEIQIKDYPFPKINPMFNGSLYEYAANHVLDIKKTFDAQMILCAMVMGEMSLCFAFVILLQDQFPIYAATTERLLVQTENHQTQKYFLFQIFREYPKLSMLNSYKLNQKNPFNLSNDKIEMIKNHHINLPYNELSLSLMAIMVSRYKLSFKVTETIYLPPFIGNSIRGALGYALKKVACGCEKGQTNLKTCTFHLLYDEGITLEQERNYFRPLVIHPSAIAFDEQEFEVGKTFNIEFSLFGKAHTHLKNILSAMVLMMKEGIGKRVNQKQGRAKIDGIYRIFPTEEILYYHQDSEKFYHTINHLNDQMPISCSRFYPLFDLKLRIDFLTPMRIFRNADLISAEDFILEDLLSTLFRRLDGYFRNEVNVSPIFTYDYYRNLANALTLKNISLRDIQLEHWSNRKDRKLSRDGFIGAIELTGEQIYELAPILWIGQYLNAGKNAMEGYGHFILRT